MKMTQLVKKYTFYLLLLELAVNYTDWTSGSQGLFESNPTGYVEEYRIIFGSSRRITDGKTSHLQVLLRPDRRLNNVSHQPNAIKSSVSPLQDLRIELAKQHLRDEQTPDSRLTNGPLDNIPRLMVDVIKKNNLEASTTEKCQNSGQREKVVRSLRNRGRMIYADQETSITELQFNFKDAFLNYEKIASATIYVAPPRMNTYLQKAGTVSYTKFHFSIHRLTHQAWKRMVKFLEEIGKLYSDVCYFDSKKNSAKFQENADWLYKLASFLGDPIATHNITFASGHVVEQTTGSLDVTSLIIKWRKEILRHQLRTGVISKALLVMTEHLKYSFRSMRHWSRAMISHRCREALHPLLIIASIDEVQHIKRTKRNNFSEKSFTHQLKFSKIISSQKNKLQSSAIKTQSKNESTLQNRLPRAIRSNICQRHPMWVNFDDLGWSDWVIAPRAIQAYKCSGECPFPLGSSLDGTNHATLMTMMNSIDPINSPMPCCVPTKLTFASLLYLDNSDNVVLRQYEDMIIESCGCR